MAYLDNYKQQHFIIYEIVLPYCTTCTISEGYTEAWHTPVTCEEPSDDEYSLFFTKDTSPSPLNQPHQAINSKSKLNSSVFRVVKTGSETTATIKPGEGMASRGTMSLSMIDFDGDPGPINFTESGTFFGKLQARNVLEGKKIISHYCSVANGEVSIVKTSTHFITKSNLSGGVFSISAKDALKDLEVFGESFPIITDDELTADITATATTIPVGDGAKYAVGDVIIIDKELMLVTAINSNNLTVFSRGATYLADDGSILYSTEAKAHSEGASVQICYLMNNAKLYDVLQDIYGAMGLSDYVDYAQWKSEVDEWNSAAELKGLIVSPDDSDKIINQILEVYMVDMWLDQETQKVIVSATSKWKESSRILSEETDFTDLKTSTSSDSRYSRAYIYNTKEFQAETDDAVNYSRLALHKDVDTESSDLYGSISLKSFDPCPFITPSSAEILVARFVQRFSESPKSLSFTMEERKLAGTGLGDIVEVISRDSQTASGEYLESRVRAQITNIKPNLNQIGRTYSIKALSYIPLIATDGADLTITVSGTVYDLNLYSRAGAPNIPLNITFIFDGQLLDQRQL